MVESISFKCPWCGSNKYSSFDIPDDTELRVAEENGYDIRYIPKFNNIYCNSCKLYFRRGIMVLQNIFTKVSCQQDE